MTAFDLPIFRQMRRNRDVLFLSLNAFGWIAWGSAQHLGGAIFRDGGNWKESTNAIWISLVVIVSGFIATSVMRRICRWLWTQTPATLLIGSLVAAYVTALPIRIAINLAQFVWFNEETTYVRWTDAIEHWYDLLYNTMWTTTLLVCWMGIYYCVHFYEAVQNERANALRAKSLAQEAQLKMLRYQLNPHFLFNTLNAVSTLVLDKQNSAANLVVTRLAEFLRHTLDQDPMKTVTLRQELHALNLYLEIEKTRFGERLAIDTHIDPSAEGLSVPSLLLQPLIENAIKYAISPNERGGRIRIEASTTTDSLVLVVADDGPGMADPHRPESGRGVGLRNTCERLKAMYGTAAFIEFANAHPGLRITMRIPKQTGGAA